MGWFSLPCLSRRRRGRDQGQVRQVALAIFPEVLANLRALPEKMFVLDGELVISVDGALSFDALQMRLHPAESRIKRLSHETPATFIVFDCLLRKARQPLLTKSFEERRATLEAFFKNIGEHEGMALTPFTRDLRGAKKWLTGREVSVDGVVAKRLDRPTSPANVPCSRSNACARPIASSAAFAMRPGRLVGSLLLGLYDDEGLLHHVGFTSALADHEKPALTKRLEKLVAPPGFTGDAPGGPSRWSTARSAEWQPLRPKLVVEVRYDHVTGNRFRHGTRLERWRPDKAPGQCTIEQLQRG